jgi:hypothetical protein
MLILQDTSLTIEPEDNLLVNTKTHLISEKNGIIKKIYFLICGSCFWCASYYDAGNVNKVTKCPCCDHSSIEFIPISRNEVYNFSYDSKRGITLEFANEEESEL